MVNCIQNLNHNLENASQTTLTHLQQTKLILWLFAVSYKTECSFKKVSASA